METDEIIWSLRLILAFALPFGTICLLLGAVNWDRKRNLILNSLFVFFGWSVSSAVVAFFCAGTLFVFDFWEIRSPIPFLIVLFMALLTVNTCVIAVILWLRKTKEENLSIIDKDSIENLRIANDRIWHTALLVNGLTLLVTTGFIVAQIDY